MSHGEINSRPRKNAFHSRRDICLRLGMVFTIAAFIVVRSFTYRRLVGTAEAVLPPYPLASLKVLSLRVTSVPGSSTPARHGTEALPQRPSRTSSRGRPSHAALDIGYRQMSESGSVV